jgi:hypothetical protein
LTGTASFGYTGTETEKEKLMEPLHYTTTLVHHSGATAFSALPDAPVVPHRARRVVARHARLRLAGALFRLANAVSPVATQRRAWAGTC